jgi:hypothetical protein
MTITALEKAFFRDLAKQIWEMVEMGDQLVVTMNDNADVRNSRYRAGCIVSELDAL